MSHATTDDVEVILLRDMTAAETALATKLLTLAIATLRRRISDIDDRMDPESENYDAGFSELVNYVEANAVARVIQNPSGASSYETIGPYSIRNGVTSTGAFAFLPDELRLLGLGGGAFTIRPYLQPVTWDDSMPPWWYDFPTADGNL